MNNIEEQALIFLYDLLPGKGLYCASHISSQGWRDEPQQSLESLVARNMQCSNAGCNTYMALSSYTVGWHIDEHGKRRFRTQQNAAYQKALWMDIDVDPFGRKSRYHTREEALNALQSFLESSGLPIPSIVVSGSGLHLYWVFDQEIMTSTWIKVAGILKRVAEACGFDHDTSRTTDPASVLRLPGTVNYGKDGVARPVILGHHAPVLPLESFLRQLLDLHAKFPIQHATPKTHQLPKLQANQYTPPEGIANNFAFLQVKNDAPLRHPMLIVKNCKQIQTAGTGDYLQWYNTITVLRHCHEGTKACHIISQTDPDRYVPADVDKKIQEAEHYGYGPALCSTFDKYNSGICSSCPFLGKVSTPLLLGEPVKPEVSPVQDMPVIGSDEAPPEILQQAVKAAAITPFSCYDFSVRPDVGIVWHLRKPVQPSPDSDGTEELYIPQDIKICDSEIYILGIIIDKTKGETKRSYIIRKKSPGRAAQDILFDVESAMGQQQIVKWLSHNGMLPIKPKYIKQMADFMSTYLASMQNKAPEIEVRDHFGWVDIFDKVTGARSLGFIFGDTLYTSTDTIKVKLTNHAERRAEGITTSGDLESWKFLPKLYNTLDQSMPKFMICASLAAPFMQFATGTANNCTINLWEKKGGKGKTTVLHVLNSIWGDTTKILSLKNDTTVARFEALSIQQNIPLCVDEITEMQDNVAAEFLYDVASGKLKLKMAPGGVSFARAGHWKTFVFTTSNRSLYEAMAAYHKQSRATSMRVIEMQCDFEDYTQSDIADVIKYMETVYRNHYGHAGRALIQFVLQHPELIPKITEGANAWDMKYRHIADERFWTTAIGTAIAVGKIAKFIGLIDFDMDALSKWCAETLLPTLRMNVLEESEVVGGYLTQFFNTHINKTLVVTSANRSEHQKDPGTLGGIDSYVKLRPMGGEIVARVEEDTQIAYVSTMSLKSWAKDQGLSVRTLLQELQSRGIYRGEKLPLSLGRNVAVIDRGRATCYKFHTYAEMNTLPPDMLSI